MQPVLVELGERESTALRYGSNGLQPVRDNKNPLPHGKQDGGMVYITNTAAQPFTPTQILNGSRREALAGSGWIRRFWSCEGGVQTVPGTALHADSSSSFFLHTKVM